VVQADGKLKEKLPGGPEHQAEQSAREGIPLLHKSKLPKVEGLAHFAWQP
jgi:hypothetical protein